MSETKDPSKVATQTSSSGEGSAQNGGKKPDGSKDPRKIEVSVNTGNIEDIIKRLKEKEDESAKLTKQLNDEMEAKKLVEKSLEEKTAEAEDFNEKLELIAEEKLSAKRKIIMDEAKKYIKDEARLKKIEEKMVKPEDVQATEFMIETLAKAFSEGQAAHQTLTEEEQKKADEEARIAAEKLAAEGKKTDAEKEAERLADPVAYAKKYGTSAGQATLAQQSGKTTGKEYDSSEAMIRDLRRRSHSVDPEVAAEAKAILDELFLRWGDAVKKEYDGRYIPIRIEKDDQPSISDIAKEGGAAMPNPDAKKRGR